MLCVKQSDLENGCWWNDRLSHSVFFVSDKAQFYCRLKCLNHCADVVVGVMSRQLLMCRLSGITQCTERHNCVVFQSRSFGLSDGRVNTADSASSPWDSYPADQPYTPDHGQLFIVISYHVQIYNVPIVETARAVVWLCYGCWNLTVVLAACFSLLPLASSVSIFVKTYLNLSSQFGVCAH